MLASSNRLKSGKDFDKVKENGKLFQSASFGVSVSNRGDKEPSRFGFVVSTKISKLASQRSRIKRALRESVRYNLKHIGKGYDMIFLTKKSIGKKFTDEIMKEVDLFVKKREFKKT
jgi:ribonuclease P protein component